MDARRARAYTRALTTITDLSAAELHPSEQEALRASADALLFAERAYDDAVAGALRQADTTVDRLVEAGRLLPETADRIVEELEACGPELQAVA